MRSACDRSTACFASWNGASGFCRIAAASIDRADASDRRRPAPRVDRPAERADLERHEHGARRGTTSAVSLPWNIGRTKVAPATGALDRRDVGDERARAAPRASARSRASDRCAAAARTTATPLVDDRRQRLRCSRPAYTARARRARRATPRDVAAAGQLARTAPADASPPDAAAIGRPAPGLLRRRSSPTSRDSACPSRCSAMTRITAITRASSRSRGPAPWPPRPAVAIDHLRLLPLLGSVEADDRLAPPQAGGRRRPSGSPSSSPP